ncbi:AAA family ATPase, partial [Chloroflexi bacterium TSY]|nr:AAA family ATPase [Chloroflexi bacterium TSY]
MPELDTITVKGFKSIAAIEKLKLGAINILIGPNGSGKSNFIDVFSLLHALREGKLQDYVIRTGGADKVLHFGSKVTEDVEIHISFHGEVNQYRILLSATETDQLYPSSEVAYFWDKQNYSNPYENWLSVRGTEAGISDPNSTRTAKFVRRHLGRWRIYHFHDTSSSSPLKKTGDVNDNHYLR